jgi:hypothetical protein
MGHSKGATPQSFGWSNPCLHLPITLVKNDFMRMNWKTKKSHHRGLVPSLQPWMDNWRGAGVQKLNDDTLLHSVPKKLCRNSTLLPQLSSLKLCRLLNPFLRREKSKSL